MTPRPRLCVGLLITFVLSLGCAAQDRALFDAIDRAETKKAIRMISSNRQLANATHWDGLPTVHLAVLKENEELLSFLLDNGADPMALGPSGLTILHVAALQNSAAIAKLLIERYGMNPNVRGGRIGQTPLMLALFNHGKTRLEALDTLLEHGADPNLKTTRALTPDECGNEPTAEGRSALMIACYVDSPSAVDILLQRGADSNLRDDEGLTTLFYCVRGFRPRGASLLMLLERGADPSVTDTNGRTVRDYAREIKRQDLVDILDSRTNRSGRQ